MITLTCEPRPELLSQSSDSETTIITFISIEDILAGVDVLLVELGQHLVADLADGMPGGQRESIEALIWRHVDDARERVEEGRA